MALRMGRGSPPEALLKTGKLSTIAAANGIFSRCHHGGAAETLIGPRADDGAAPREAAITSNGLIGSVLTPPAIRRDVH
jgi:hypothetical protein